MIKFFSNYKIVFYSINFSLIFLYLFPGSLLGQVLYSSKKIQPQITPDFIISSNHFYVFVLLSVMGFLTFTKNNQTKYSPFLSFSSHEGLGLPPIEAAIAGNKVIGYTGEAGKEWWYKPIFSEIYSGDLQSFCKEILNFIKFKKNHQKIFSNQKKKLIKEFSEENQKKYILDFLKKI